jgi:hypothetical protein
LFVGCHFNLHFAQLRIADPFVKRTAP